MHNVFHWSAKLTLNESDIDKAIGPMHQSVITKIENFVRKDWIVKTITEHVIQIS